MRRSLDMETLLKTHRVCFARHGVEILRDISLEVKKGDFLSVVGPNGAGKTTLLKILTGILRPDSGSCERGSGLKIGYMPQRLEGDGVMPISAKRFISLCYDKNGTDFDSVCRETGVSSVLDRPLYNLSGGEMQRVMLARALMNNPDLLVLDEPAQNLDVSGQLHFYKALQEIHLRRGIAILMVSHDLHMVMSSTKTVICLYVHVCCAGKPTTVVKDPEFIAILGEEMARLMSVYPHSHDHEHAGSHTEPAVRENNA